MTLSVLEKYGFSNFFMDKLPSLATDEDDLCVARISSVQKDRFTILKNDGEKGASLKGSEFYGGVNAVFPAVGDFVLVKENLTGDDIIYTVLNRRTKFSRLDSFNVKEQVVAANFDFVLIMMSANKDFNRGRLERYSTSAWQSGGVPVVVITKADLCSDLDELVLEAEMAAPGVDVLAVSSLTGQGMERLSQYTGSGLTSVLLGSSGVGKSSLVNALAGREIMKVNLIREDDAKGRHTTTYRQLIVLADGGMVIDTPGMRELGMWDVSEGIGESFADIEELAEGCRFSDCTHINEPGCAVRQALNEGSLPEKRWNSYLKLKRESEFARRKEAARLARMNKKSSAARQGKNPSMDYQ